MSGGDAFQRNGWARLERLLRKPIKQLWGGVAQLKLSGRLSLLPLVRHEALIHAVVLFLNLFQHQPWRIRVNLDAVVVDERLSVVHPNKLVD